MNNKIITIIILSFVILIGIVVYLNRSEEKAVNDHEQSSANETDKKDIRQAVWKQLPSNKQELIKGTWKDAVASKTTIGEDTIISIDNKLVKGEPYAGKGAYVVDFPTKSKGVPNNMLVLADSETFAIIGYLPVD